MKLAVAFMLVGMALLAFSTGALSTIVHAIAPSPFAASINLVKLTNGTDNNSAPGPSVPVGSTVTFTYTVTNTGSVALSGVTVRDDNGTPGSTSDDFDATFVGGDTTANGMLDTTETWTFTASRIATPGQYTNIATAASTSPVASDTDSDNHFGGPIPNIFGVSTTNQLVRFSATTPGTIVSSVPITGLAGGEAVLGIDFRPTTDQLFALGSTSRLYVLDYTSNPASAIATPVGNAGAFTLNGTAFGFDFNPTVDRIRVVSEADQNLRLNPNDGSLAATDTPLAYAGADANTGANPNVVGSAYTNNVNGATTTTLYGIDTGLDVLVTQNPPNAGALNTMGALGVNASNVLGFDISAANTAYATMVVGGTPGLYTIDLSGGAATLVGPIGGGLNIRGMAIAPEGFAVTTLSGTTATFNGGTACESITFDQSGGLLRHNRFSAGDPGFSSDFDFDPSTPGDQTLSATDPAVTIIVNAGGCDDRINVGSPSSPASGLAATFQLNGQGGGDALTIDDTADSTARAATLNGSTSTVTGIGGPVTYGTLENVTVNAGSGGDTLNVQGTPAAVTSVFAGGGDDTVAFGNGATLSGGLLDGGPGTNTLDYSGYTTAVTVDLSAAQAQTLFLATLSGAQEPGPLSNSPATGSLVGTLNAAQTALTFNIAYQGLTGSPISGTHFHNQSPGVNGPIVRGLFPSEQNGLTTPSGTFSGVWSTSDPTLNPPASDAPIRPLNAPSPVTPGSTLVQELLAGRIYFNIHTLPNFPSGEIRGQLVGMGTVNPATGTGGVRGFDNVTGGSGGDALTGNASVNVLRGGPGGDTITGGQGGDQLFGDAGNDLLVWNNGDGSDFMEGGGNNDTVQVNGSTAGGDQFLLQVNPADPTRLRFDRTNLGLFNLNIGTTEALDFNTLGGDDTTTVEFAGGNPIPSGIASGPGIDFDGGAGGDQLVLQRSAGTFVAAAETYTATGPGSGDITVDGGLIRFSDLTPVTDTVPATNFTFTAPGSSPALNVVNGPAVGGFNTTQINDLGTGSFELITFANKANVTANSGTTSQLINVNGPTASGLASLTVNGNAGSDTFNVKASATATINVNGGLPLVSPGDSLNYDTEGRTVSGDTTPPDGTISSPGVQPVNFTGIEAVNLPNVPLSINDVAVTEGDSGSVNAVFTVTLPSADSQAVTVDYVTGNGTATAPADYTSVSGTLTFAPGQTSRTITVPVNGDTLGEADETFFVTLSNPLNATLSDSQGTGTILNDDGIQFSQALYTVNEHDGSVTITVRRLGDTSQPASVEYMTDDGGTPAVATPCSSVTGIALERCDYTYAAGTLNFAAGEAEKTFVVLVSKDSYVEGTEVTHLRLSNPGGGGSLGSLPSADLQITDDPLQTTNPIDDPQDFVRQHYHDFLNREPDPPGFTFWTNQMTNCGSPNLEVCRVNVSAAFFLSIEFQQTGFLVGRMYKAAYGDATGNSALGGAHQLAVPVVRLHEFLPDTQRIGRGVIVGQGAWQQQLESNKAAFALEFVSRPRFTTAYLASMTAEEFVTTLDANAGGVLTPAEIAQLEAVFGGPAASSNDAAKRARVLRSVAENATLQQREFNRAFVLMQYFGYLRRNPNDAPDADYTGYDFWLAKLDQFHGDFVKAEMVKAFLQSDEYRHRFGL